MPGPRQHPPIPPTSARDVPLFRDHVHRTTAAGAFRTGADGYHAVRPGYPPEVVELIPQSARTVADIGAGTGKLTERLLIDGRDVIAVEPSQAMLDVLGRTCPGAQRIVGKAEATGLAGRSMDAVVSAQTWHWVDAPTASAEMARILAPEGRLVLVWNTLDVQVPWVHRLTRIMHSGDVLKPGFMPEVAAPLVLEQELRLNWVQELTTEEVLLLAKTRSYWLNAKAATREKVAANLRWYLFEHLGFAPGDVVPLPYRCDAFVYLAEHI